MIPPLSECPACAAALPLLREASAALGRPVLVGIGGPGGSGKSSFSLAISRHLEDARILPLTITASHATSARGASTDRTRTETAWPS